MEKIKTLSSKTILVTGSAGFIGFHLSKKLLEAGATVIGIDNFNNYYDVSLKEARNDILQNFDTYTSYRGDLCDIQFIKKVLREQKIDKICNLAAQAGVRHSLTHPHDYVRSNIIGFVNLLDEAKENGIKDFIYASSSSVYGKNEKYPFSVEDAVDKPVSIYGATKKANELIAHSYHHLFGMNCTGLRFFTVYGPYGRPDMAYFSFTKDILSEKSIKIFNFGKMRRDFTYIDDIVDGIISALYHSYPYEIFNLGNNKPIELGYFIECIEKELGISAKKEFLPIQPGDIPETYADIDYTYEKLGFSPKIPIEDGIKNFVKWYQDYYLPTS